MHLPPGIHFLLSSPGIFGPPLVLSFAYYISTRFLQVDLDWVPQWTRVLLLLLSAPATFVAKIYAERWRQWGEARRMGAVFPLEIPSSWPGSIDVLHKLFQGDKDSYLGDFAWKWGVKLGRTFRWNVLFEPRLITSEPEHVKAVLATEFNKWEKGPFFKRQMQSLLGDGVFNADGEMWKFHRSMTRPFFSKERISHFEIFGRHADEAIELMRTRLATGHAVDFQDLVSRFTLDSATEFLFGDCLNVLSAGLPYSPEVTTSADILAGDSDVSNYATTFSHAFAMAQSQLARRSRFAAFWPLFEFWEDKTTKHMKVIDRYVEPILRKAVERKRERDAAGLRMDAAGKSTKTSPAVGSENGVINDEETLLGHLVEYTDDLHILKDEILNIMLAGRDTTAATLTFVIYMLALYPDIHARVRAEVLKTIGSTRRPTYDDLREMKYLRAVINETLRLYPPVPFNQRTCIKSTTFPGRNPQDKPWYVPSGTKCMYSVFIMHRRTDLWGPDAHKFDPDRFLDSRLHTYLTPNPFIFLPFNAGPRICLGQQFAYGEVSYMLIRLLQRFTRVHLAPDAQPAATRAPEAWRNPGPDDNVRKAEEHIWPKSHLTLYATGGLWVRMEEAPASEADTA